MSFWSQKIVLVTGASSGLGLHLSRAWIEAGATVVMVARDATKLELAATTLTDDSSRVVAIPCDITIQSEVDRLVVKVQERLGRLDVLVNCAGVSARGTIAETPLPEFERLWQLNVMALVRCTQAALPMLRASHGSIVNIGSLAGKVAPRFVGGYAATKHAVTAISQQLRMELVADGVHVLHVCPGPLRRDDASQRYSEQLNALPEQAAKPGAGARLKGIDPAELSSKILKAVEARRSEMIVPAKVRILLVLAAISTSCGDWLLRKSTGG